METREYKLPLGDLEEGYAVIAYSGRYGVPGKGHYLPIKVNTVKCRRAGKDIDIAEVVCSFLQDDGDVDQEVRSDYVNILHGRNPAWILCAFQVMMTGICLKYYNAKRNVSEEIHLNIARIDSKTELHMEFSVPHVDGRADSTYWFYNIFTPSSDRKQQYSDSWVVLESMKCFSQNTITFYLEDGHEMPSSGSREPVFPDYAIVTEYIDV